MSTSYADRAQGVELDRRLDEWGNPKPIVNEFDLFHPYDRKVTSEREAAYRKGLSLRIQATMAQMEMVCPPIHGDST